METEKGIFQTLSVGHTMHRLGRRIPDNVDTECHGSKLFRSRLGLFRAAHIPYPEQSTQSRHSPLYLSRVYGLSPDIWI